MSMSLGIRTDLPTRIKLFNIPGVYIVIVPGKRGQTVSTVSHVGLTRYQVSLKYRYPPIPDAYKMHEPYIKQTAGRPYGLPAVICLM